MATVTEDPRLKMAVDRIIERFDPVRILLFGSRARGDQREDSDYDFLIVLDEVGNKFEIMGEAFRQMRDLPISKDIVVTDETEYQSGGLLGSVVRSAIAEGVKVYERPAS